MTTLSPLPAARNCSKKPALHRAQESRVNAGCAEHRGASHSSLNRSAPVSQQGGPIPGRGRSCSPRAVVTAEPALSTWPFSRQLVASTLPNSDKGKSTRQETRTAATIQARAPCEAEELCQEAPGNESQVHLQQRQSRLCDRRATAGRKHFCTAHLWIALCFPCNQRAQGLWV